jgi:hypothetical protein
MIELEIQGLSQDREGLLIDVGRLVMAHGFTLQRQRLVQDPHGILLTMVVRGPRGGRKSLQTALDGYERFVSVQLFPFVDGEAKPHFAASLPKMAYTPPPAPPEAAAPLPVTRPPAADVHEDAPPTTPGAEATSAPPSQSVAAEPEFEFIQPTPRPPAPTPATETVSPFVELVPEGPDEPAVDKMLRVLESRYPDIAVQLLMLQQSVTDAARDSSLALAGRRTGNWVFEREYALDDGLDLREAIERIGVPALRVLVEVDQQGHQLHIHDSPLCTRDGQSGCGFFSGFLEGLLEPSIAPNSLTIFPVCCRSYGADACVLDLSN